MGILKKYTANTQVSVNIVLPNGKSTRVAFSGKTLGKSAYYTSDPDIQSGLENHYRFGKLFALDPDFEAPRPTKKPNKKKESVKDEVKEEANEATKETEPTDETSASTEETTENPETAPETSKGENPESEEQGDEYSDDDDEGEESEGEQTPEPEVMAFSDYGAAKEYICKAYGIARTKLKTQESIEEAAKSFGITLNIG